MEETEGYRKGDSQEDEDQRVALIGDGKAVTICQLLPIQMASNGL